MMNPDDLIEELENLEDAQPQSSDCGCGGASTVFSGDEADDLAALEAELDALESGELDDPTELSAAVDGLGLDDELEFAVALGDEGQAGAITLEDVFELAKRYPGLRISFGF